MHEYTTFKLDFYFFFSVGLPCAHAAQTEAVLFKMRMLLETGSVGLIIVEKNAFLTPSLT